MQRVVLITGGTGTLGRELVERFAGDAAAPRLFVLSRRTGANPRASGGAPAEAAPGDEVQRHDAESEGAGGNTAVTFLRGDLCAEGDLGLTAPLRRMLSQEVTDILHCAAATTFTLPLEEARATNVGGTLALLSFAETCRSLRQIGCFSTVYVAGRRKGRFGEDDLDDGGAGFVNSYEQSKSEMEGVLRRRMADLPVAVYRLSTLAGDSRTGAVRGFNAFHYALRLLYQGLAPMIPGNERHRIDLVPVDYVADAVHWLFWRKFSAGATYHLCAGPERSAPLGDLLDTAMETFCRLRPEWRRRGIERPAVVDLDTYELFVRSVEETRIELLRRATNAVQSFVYQLAYPKTFDASRAQAELAESGLRPPPVLAYYPKVIRYCLETSWGTQL